MSEEMHDDIEEVVKDEGVMIPESKMTPDDALAVLMSATPVRATCVVDVEGREGMGKLRMVLRSLNDNEIKQIRKAAEKPLTKEQKRRGEEAELDDALYSRLVVVNGVQSPKLNTPELLQQHSVSNAEQLVNKLFLAGHVRLIFAEIMRVSGYSEDAVTVVDELGND